MTYCSIEPEYPNYEKQRDKEEIAITEFYDIKRGTEDGE